MTRTRGTVVGVWASLAALLVMHQIASIANVADASPEHAVVGRSLLQGLAGLVGSMLLAGYAARRIGGILHPNLTARPVCTSVPCGLTAYVVRVARLWVALLPLVALLYLTYENVEHLRSGLPLVGITPLTGGASASLLLVVVASLVASLVAALADWCRCVLARRFRAAMQVYARQDDPRHPRRVWEYQPRGSTLVLASAGRSPPAVVITRP